MYSDAVAVKIDGAHEFQAYALTVVMRGCVHVRLFVFLLTCLKICVCKYSAVVQGCMCALVPYARWRVRACHLT